MLNLMKAKSGPPKGYKQALTTCQNISKAKMGHIVTAEARQKISAALTGKPAEGRPRIQICSRGHDKAITGVVRRKVCAVCNSEQSWWSEGILNTDGTPFITKNYDYHFEMQGGRCKLKSCNKSVGELKKKLVVDHDHVTKLFRGLVCSGCNSYKIGTNNLESAKALIDYLESPKFVEEEEAKKAPSEE